MEGTVNSGGGNRKELLRSYSAHSNATRVRGPILSLRDRSRKHILNAREFRTATVEKRRNRRGLHTARILTSIPVLPGIRGKNNDDGDLIEDPRTRVESARGWLVINN